MQVLITGAAGFIGSHLADHCVNLGWDVAGIDNLSSGVRDNISDRIRFVEGSILDTEALSQAIAGVDAVVHLAARPSVPRSVKDPVASHENNATGTLHVLQAARAANVKQVIVASSSSVYGANPALPKVETMTTMPMSPYAVSKVATEQYAVAFQHTYGLGTLAFRFFNVFGPRQLPGHAYAAVVPAFLDAALSGKPLIVHGDGLQSRDFTYVGTVCATITDAIERQVTSSTPVNLAFGSRVSLLDLIIKIEEAIGTRPAVEHIEMRVGDVKHSQADNGLLQSLFPSISPVSLEEGLAATLDWFRSRT